MYRLEIKIFTPDETNFQVIWKDVESEEAGMEHGAWVKQEYSGTGKEVKYRVLPEKIQYRFKVYLEKPYKGEWEVGVGEWFDDMQDAANYGWMKMRELNANGYTHLHGMLVDSTDHVRANLLGRDTAVPIPHVDSDKLRALTEAVDNLFKEKMGRASTAWKENGSSILDIVIAAPRGVFKAQFENGIRTIDIKGDAQFLSDIKEPLFQQLFAALRAAGRNVNDVLKTTTA